MPNARPRLLLACEMGGGRGHVAKLARIARACGPGVDCLAAFATLRHTAELAAAGVTVMRAPRLRLTEEMRADPLLRGNATWACYLAASGLARPEVVQNALRYWRQTIVHNDVSVLVADYAPLALRAALGLREEGWEIRILSVGTGYGVPPPGLPRFPPLHPDYTRVVHPEEETLATLNAVSASFGWSPLPRLSAIYEADLAMPATFAMLDPYAPWRDPEALVPPIVDRSADLAAGDGLFVYFSRNEPDMEPLLQALERLPLPRFGFLPAISADTRARLQASGMQLSDRALSATEIAARARVVLHGAAHGSLCQSALAGLVQVGLPDHKEQVVHGTRAAEAGMMRMLPLRSVTAAELLDALQAAATDAPALAHAHGIARDLRSSFPADPMADLSSRLRPQIDAARAFVTG